MVGEEERNTAKYFGQASGSRMKCGMDINIKELKVMKISKKPSYCISLWVTNK